MRSIRGLRRQQRGRHRRSARNRVPGRLPGQAWASTRSWLTPFYPSDLADGGYDVIDHRDVDPRIGTLADFHDALVEALHARDIRLLIDIVPNHSSDRHPWFRQARQRGPRLSARERYHFYDGPDGGLPPTDWRSLFGGSAWTQLPDGQWYLHTFAAEQPDLNWASPEVRAYFLDTLRFWADRGVDGFQDAAHMLTQDMSHPLPTQAELEAHPRDGLYPTWDRDELHDIAEWREVFATPTIRRARRSPEQRCSRHGCRSTPARRRWVSRSSSTCNSPTTTPPASAGSSTNAWTWPPYPVRR